MRVRSERGIEAFQQRQRVVDEPFVGDHHTLRRTGGTRGMDDVGRLVCGNSDCRHDVNRGLREQRLEGQLRQAADPRRAEDESRTRILLDRIEQGLRCILRHRYVGSTQAQAGEQADHVVPVAWRAQQHAIAATHAMRREHCGCAHNSSSSAA